MEIQETARITLNIRKAKITDHKRWKQKEELYLEWDQRTAILASMISPGTNSYRIRSWQYGFKESPAARLFLYPFRFIQKT